MNEGYVKFNCTWEQKEILISEDVFKELQHCRSQLYELKLIGIYPDGIGFGNISVKNESGFIITGSATGQFVKLDRSNYAQVNRYNIEKNSITCSGLTKASAESLTHAAVYESIPEAGAVVHVHCLWLWEKLLDIFPATSADIKYGTPEMADAVGNLASGINKKEEKIIIMGGHQEGILTFGSNLNEATNQIINIYNRYKND